MDTEIIRFFDRVPEVLPLYDEIKKIILGDMENVSVKVQKSQIAFYSNKSFAFVWLPLRKTKGRPETYLILSFGLDHQIISSRIVESVEPYPNRWTHHVIIQKISDFDDEVRDWIRQAYQFSLRK